MHVTTGRSELSEALFHLLEAAMAVAFLIYKVRTTKGRSMSDAGYARRGVLTETLAGCVIGFALISVVLGILHRVGVYHALRINPDFSPWMPLVSFLGVAVFEETLFRGFIFRITEYRNGSLIALVVSSLIFGLLHLLNVASLAIPFSQKLIGPVFISFEAGLLLGAAYMATRRLWLPIGIHWMWNFFEGPVYGASVSGNAGAQNTLVYSTLHGPFLLTGGSFGPEGSVVCAAVGFVFGLAMLLVVVRRGEWRAGNIARSDMAN